MWLCLYVCVLHPCQLHGINPRFPRRAAETTFVSQIFGGYLRSQVMCPKCGYKSNTYDPFLDLSLPLSSGEGSVTRALRSFTVRVVAPSALVAGVATLNYGVLPQSAERLRKGEEWRCAACRKQVRATKQLTIHRVRGLPWGVHPRAAWLSDVVRLCSFHSHRWCL